MHLEIDRPSIGSCRYKGENRVGDVLNNSRTYFDGKGIRAEIEAQAHETLAWLRANSQSYTPDGHLEFDPWWPMPPETDCLMVKTSRMSFLMDRAYEHGILNLLRGLQERGVIDPLNDRVIDLVTQAMTRVVLNQLAANWFAPNAPNGVTLAKLSELFGNGKNTKPARIRDRLLGDLATIGLFKGREKQGYDISIGVVGEVFFSKVYAPIVHETNINYKGQKK